MLKVANYSREIFDCSNFDEKRQITNIILSNLKLNGDKLVYDYNQPFNMIEKYVRCSEWHAVIDAFRSHEVVFDVDKVWAKKQILGKIA